MGCSRFSPFRYSNRISGESPSCLWLGLISKVFLRKKIKALDWSKDKDRILCWELTHPPKQSHRFRCIHKSPANLTKSTVFSLVQKESP